MGLRLAVEQGEVRNGDGGEFFASETCGHGPRQTDRGIQLQEEHFGMRCDLIDVCMYVEFFSRRCGVDLSKRIR